MNKKISRITVAVLFVFTALMIMCSVSICANAAKYIDNGDYVYKVLDDGKSVSITKYNGKSLYVSLPSFVDDYTVTAVDAAAFMSNSTIKELEIAGTITSISANAFAECTSLQKLQIPGNVKTIGDSAFVDCTSLKSVTIYDGVKNIGNYCFSGCKKLEVLNLPNSLDVIGQYAFFGCSSLENVQIPKALKSFGGYALEGTKWMKNQKSEFVVIGDGILIKYNGKEKSKSLPENIKSIGEYAFAKNKEITTILLSRTVSKIEKCAFEDCTSLETVSLPNNVLQIGEGAFRGCGKLDKVTLPNQLARITKGTFEECSGMQTIVIPKSVTVIEEYAFSGCTGLESIKFESNGIQTIESGAFNDCVLVGRMVFPETLKEIKAAAFVRCYSLTRAEFNGDTKLNSSTFTECDNLSEVMFYKNPTALSPNVFNGCSENLTLYSDNSLYVQQYASDNNYKSDISRNLPVYENKGVLLPNPKGEQEFSSGYTVIAVMIVIVDFAAVVLFSIYIFWSWKNEKTKTKSSKFVSKTKPKGNIQHSKPQGKK